MTHSFSFTRLWRLIVKQGTENGRFYLLYGAASLGIIGLLMAFWMTIITRNEYFEEHYYSYLLLALFLCGTLFANLQFDALSKKSQGIAWLSFPASHLEKFLCSLFYVVIVFNGLFLGAAMVIKWSLIYCIKHGFFKEAVWHGMTPPFIESQQFYFIYLFIAVQSFYLLGSVYFERFSFIKTTVLLAALVGLCLYYFYFLHENVLGSFYTWSNENGLIAEQHTLIGAITYKKAYKPAPWLTETIFWLMKYGWAPACWIITWKRLTEKEI